MAQRFVANSVSGPNDEGSVSVYTNALDGFSQHVLLTMYLGGAVLSINLTPAAARDIGEALVTYANQCKDAIELPANARVVEAK